MKNQIPFWKVRRDLKIIAEVDTDTRFGKNPEERTIDEHIRLGMINLDKPPNPSSHEVASWVKRILGVSHVGHGGTLEAKKPGKPHGNWCTPNSDRGCDQSCSDIPLLRKGIRLPNATP